MAVFWIFAAIVLLFGFVVFRGAPYVPSLKKDVRLAFAELYPLTSDDLLVDVGSGDGVILRMAARRGARAVGYELNPALVVISKLLARRYPNVSVRLADFWLTELPAETTIVYAFAVRRDVKKLTTKFQATADRLGRPFHVISYGSELARAPVKRAGAHFLYEFRPLHQ